MKPRTRFKIVLEINTLVKEEDIADYLYRKLPPRKMNIAEMRIKKMKEAGE